MVTKKKMKQFSLLKPRIKNKPKKILLQIFINNSEIISKESFLRD